MKDEARRPVDLHLLLALVDGPLHGYGLAGRIEEQSESRVRFLPGNLYAILQRLVEEGLLCKVPAPEPASGQDARRKYFGLTPLGRRVLEAELGRLRRLVISKRVRSLLAAAAERGEP